MQEIIRIDHLTLAKGIEAALTRKLLESRCHTGLQWLQYVPANTPRLWEQVRNDVGAHVSLLWAFGFFQEKTRKEGFFVTCDLTTMTGEDRNSGRIICEVAYRQWRVRSLWCSELAFTYEQHKLVYSPRVASHKTRG